MASIRVDFRRLNDVQRFLTKLPKELDKKLSKTNERFMTNVRDDAILIAPIDTGRLKGSIVLEPVRRGKNVKKWKLVVGANHGYFQEHGFKPHYAFVTESYKYPGNVGKQWFVKKNTPFVGPSFERNVGKYLNNLKVSTTRAIAAAGFRK
jgi:hypothetical protein